MIRIGILGCADIAKRSVIPALLNLKNKFKIIGIGSRSKQKSKIFQSEFGITPYLSYQSLIDEGNLDAVYIPLPNSLHFEWIKKSLNNNIHVLVEKSMCCTYEEVKIVNEIAFKKKLVLMENFQFRFHDQLKTIQDLIKNNEIGELRCLRSSFGFPPFKSKNNIRYNPNLGGGALLDAGAYPIKVSQIFLGESLNVCSSNLYMDSKLGVDIWGGAYLKQRDGELFSEIAFGFDNYYQCNLELWGSKGILKANRIFTAPIDLTINIEIYNNGCKVIPVEPSNHFVNLLNYFFKLTTDNEKRILEYNQNLMQSNLIEQLKRKSYD